MPKQLEHGQVGGLYFIASELVAGFNLHQILRSKKQLDERLGLKIIADALKGLSTMHAGGMVHRDVKPANILVLFDDENEWSEATYQSSKLTDFGLARFIDQSDSMEITRKLCIGTPLFQAPEQFTQSDTVSPSLDIYSIGITLYFLLAGKTPFENRDILYLAEQHRKVVPPKLLHVDSSISGATSSIVVKAIEKNPGMRYQDADSMLKDVERVLAGRPIKISSLSPKTNLVQDGVQNFTLQWELNCNIENIWPLVADTDRFNRAIKLPPVKFAFVGEGENRQLVASTCHKGMNLQWLEHPFEWVEGRELSVLREFIAGPFVWLLSRIELSKTDNDKTLLTHKLEVKPRGWLGKWFSWFQFKVISKRAIGKAYKKMEWIAQQGLDSSAWDSDFFSSPSLRQKNAEQVLNLLKQIRPKIKDEQLRLFADYLTTASDAAVTRIRPKYLAARLGCDLPEFLEFAFGCIQAGALAMMWDVICPVCRIASNTFNSIEEIKKHHRCEACNDSFPVDYARAVELVFRVHPDVRKADTRTYCIGGPFHLPHVVAQLTVGSSENYSVETQNHSPTKMLVRGPSIPNVHHLVQSNDGKVNRLAIELLTPSELPELKTGTLALQLENSSNEPLLIRLERSAQRDQATTAGEVFSYPFFHNLCPQECLAPEQLVSSGFCTVLGIRLFGLNELALETGEVQAQAELAKWTAALKNLSDGRLVNGDVSTYIFQQSDCAAISYREFTKRILNSTTKMKFATVVEAGEVLVGFQNGHPNYFGPIIRSVSEKLAKLQPGEKRVARDLKL